MSRVLVTGATGFVGNALVERLAMSSSWQPMLGLRREQEMPLDYPWVVAGDLSPDTDWYEALKGCDAVVHCAARVHVIDDPEADPLAAFRRANVQGTLHLAQQAAQMGVSRFIFISSIKVNGEQTTHDTAFTADDEPAPIDPYGISKFEAEQELLELAERTSMEVLIIRPPLVYGPRVKGNFANMIKLVEKGLPLPFGAIHNKRSLVALDNLVDLIITCIDHPAAANQVFLAGDGQDVSTTELLLGVGRAMGKPTRLIPVPARILMFSASVLGKKDMANRLLGSLQVDITKAQVLLGWKPPLTFEEGLQRCFDSESVS